MLRNRNRIAQFAAAAALAFALATNGPQTGTASARPADPDATSVSPLPPGPGCVEVVDGYVNGMPYYKMVCTPPGTPQWEPPIRPCPKNKPNCRKP